MTGKVTPKRLPKPRTMLGWDGTDFFAVKVDGSGHLQIDVLSTVQDPAATTWLRQGHVLAAIQNLYPLVTALQSVHTDRLKVRGENQLLTYGGQIIAEVNGTPAAAGGNTMLGGIVPDGEVWIITSMSARAWGNPVTACYLGGQKAATNYWAGMYGATLARVGNSWAGTMPLVKDDRPVCYLDGCTAGDDIRFFYFGYWMTLET